MGLYMATTQITADKSANEVGIILASHGATETMMVYENGVASGLSFRINKGGRPVSFQLPVRADKVLVAMKNDRRIQRRLCNQEQAARVAWRLILRWVQSQLALVEVGVVDLAEVFLPYAHTSKGLTLYESLTQDGVLALPERASR